MLRLLTYCKSILLIPALYSLNLHIVQCPTFLPAFSLVSHRLTACARQATLLHCVGLACWPRARCDCCLIYHRCQAVFLG
ncbi:hypothetical protein BDR05DRAFT_195175 [Suillus weaverae]|nr:hypothetical protein BDR05DRAFT_195175 [Suillus weaverae]